MRVAQDSGAAPAVRMENIGKRYGNVVALKNIDLEIGGNEIVGLIGDNGAGKSTLIKILTGVEAPTSGRMYVRGKPVDFADYSVRKAHELGVETVYQESSLGDKQPLWRNFFVGRNLTNRWGFIKVKEQKRIARQVLMGAIGFRGAGLDVDATVGRLSGGERQGVAIGRAMHFDADLIVLDEPTVALAVMEVRKVLDFIADIKQSGRACLYIEHTLAQVHQLADRLLIMDRGEIVRFYRQGEVSLDELTNYLLALHGDQEAAA